jgi:hypothetical protein
MRRLLLIAGALAFITGLAWPWLARLPFGTLPGDIRITRPGFTFFFLLGTSILLSIVLSVVLVVVNWFVRR